MTRQTQEVGPSKEHVNRALYPQSTSGKSDYIEIEGLLYKTYRRLYTNSLVHFISTEQSSIFKLIVLVSQPTVLFGSASVLSSIFLQAAIFSGKKFY